MNKRGIFLKILKEKGRNALGFHKKRLIFFTKAGESLPPAHPIVHGILVNSTRCHHSLVPYILHWFRFVDVARGVHELGTARRQVQTEVFGEPGCPDLFRLCSELF
jgi:hypothetical protein